MVMFSYKVAGSHSVLTTFGTVIGMPTMHLKTYLGHKKVTGLCVFLLIGFNLPLLPNMLRHTVRIYLSTTECIEE